MEYTIYYREVDPSISEKAFLYLLLDNLSLFPPKILFLEKVPYIEKGYLEFDRYKFFLKNKIDFEDIPILLNNLIVSKNIKYLFVDGPNKVGKSTILKNLEALNKKNYFLPVRLNRKDPTRYDSSFFKYNLELFIEFYNNYGMVEGRTLLLDRFFISQFVYHPEYKIEDYLVEISQIFSLERSYFLLLLPKNYKKVYSNNLELYDRYMEIASNINKKFYKKIKFFDIYDIQLIK